MNIIKILSSKGHGLYTTPNPCILNSPFSCFTEFKLGQRTFPHLFSLPLSPPLSLQCCKVTETTDKQLERAVTNL